MEISQKQEQDSIILQPGGRLDAGSAPELEARFHALEGDGAVILDCACLDYVSSAGLRVVLAAAKRYLGMSRPFLLCGMNPQVEEIFRLAGFHHILAICPDLASALTDVRKS